VIEVLLSSVSALELMSGKIAGSVATGLTMVLSWAFFFILLTSLLPLAVDLGSLDLGAILTNPVYCFSFLGYFLMGYLFFAALLVGLGSACNSLKEAQNLMQPVMIVFIVPLLALVPVTMDPQGTLARVLSFIPPFTPFVMMNRAAGPPETWEYVATTVLMLVSVTLAFWGAAKIFRVGILMTGKPPRVGEILRWLRAPVGQVPERAEERKAEE
jgi:ABC-type Na+ efflux pump permease subunit